MFIYAEYHWHCCKPAFRQASETRSENICRCFSGAKLVLLHRPACVARVLSVSSALIYWSQLISRSFQLFVLARRTSRPCVRCGRFATMVYGRSRVRSERSVASTAPWKLINIKAPGPKTFRGIDGKAGKTPTRRSKRP